MAEIQELLSPKAEKQVKTLIKDIKRLVKWYAKLAVESKKVDDQLGDSGKNTKKTTDAEKRLIAVKKESARITKATLSANAKLMQVSSEGNKILLKKTTLLKRQNDIQKINTALENKEIGTLERLALKNRKLANERKKLNLETKKGQTRLKEINRELDKNNRFISKNADAQQKQFRGIGRYADAIKGVAARFVGWGIAIAAVTRALKSGIEIVLNYSFANSTLNAILGVTGKETESLTKQQLELGKSTAFTATQVTKAQTELARLGLSMAEITKLTPSILNAAVAFGVDMAQAAELVAGQLNAFNLEASEGKRVADVLVKATQISAFTYQRLFDALKVVSPAAEAVGASIEETTAILSAAVDANIDAGTASTALRNIFIELSDSGITWADGMEQINSSTNRLSKANELFGKRGSVVATVIANNTEKIDRNTIALNNAAGAADAFAKEQLDNLRGDMTLLTSAWEGFILGIETGDGALARFARGSLQLFTNLLGKLTPILETQRQELTKQKIELTALVSAIQKSNKHEGLRERLITKLNKQYPEFLKNIDQESLSNEILTKRLKEVNAELERKFLIQLKEEELQKLFLALTKARLNERDATIELAKANKDNWKSVETLVEAQKNLDAAYKTNDADIIENAKNIFNSILIINDSRRSQEKLRLEIEETSTAYDELGGSIEMTKSSLSELGKKEDVEAKRLKDIKRQGIEDKKSQFLQDVEGQASQNEILKSQEQKLNDDLFEINELARDREKEAQDKADAEDIAAQTKKNKDIETLVMAGVQVITEVLRNFTDLRLRQISDEMAADNTRRQSELMAVEGDKNKQAQINAKYDKKQAILKKKQWQEEKKAALIQVTINTALAVVKSIGIFGAPPSPPGIAAIIASAAIGAIQTGIILAQKPPKFAKGSKGLSKDTYGEVGEAGRELLMFPSGDVGMATKSTKLAMPKGTVIKSNRDTEKILAANQMKAQRENDVMLKDYSELRMLSDSIKEDRKAILKAVKDQNQYSFNVSVKGVKAMMRNNKGTTTYLDNRFR